MPRHSRFCFVALSLASLFTGCRETLFEPARVSGSATAVAMAIAPTLGCDRRWATAITGDWSDPARWSPYGVPLSTDRVCIDVAGSYTVSLYTSADIRTLSVGDGVSFVRLYFGLWPNTSTLAVSDTIVVRAGAGLTIGSGAAVEVASTSISDDGVVFNDGDITTEGSDPSLAASLLVNQGRLILNGIGAAVQTDTAANHGTVSIGAHVDWTSRKFHMAGGDVRGTGRLIVHGTYFTWTGGVLSPNASDSSRAVTRVRSTLVDLESASLTGRIELQNADAPFDAQSVLGDIGAGVHLVSMPDSAGSLVFTRDSAGMALSATNYGRIEIRPQPGGVSRLRLLQELFNRGTIVVDSDSTTWLDEGRLVNRGVIDVVGDLAVAGSGNIENHGTMTVRTVDRLTMHDGTIFDARTGSRLTGSLELEGGTLTGTGTVGFVRSVGGTIVAGGPYGTLATGSVVLDSTSRLAIALSSLAPGGFGQLSVTGSMQIDGTLDVSTIAPFVGGVCGQMVPIVVVSWIHGGRFRQVTGLTLGSTSAWRTRYSSNVVELSGHDPSAPLGFAPARASTIVEGGASTFYYVCLGMKRPTSSVFVASTDVLGQVTSQPSPLVFTTSDWDLPHRLTITAVDDAVAEGPQSGSVRLAAQSGDAQYDKRTAGPLAVAVTDNDPMVDVAVSLVSSPASVTLNQTFEVRYRVRNNGPGASSGSTVTITPMAGLTFQSSSPTVPCTANTGQTTCTVGALASGTQIEFVVVYRAVVSGLQSNTVRVIGREYDGVSSNNSFVWNVTVN
jgi:hypothetical protein